jgi:hypothetical protein
VPINNKTICLLRRNVFFLFLLGLPPTALFCGFPYEECAARVRRCTMRVRPSGPQFESNDNNVVKIHQYKSFVDTLNHAVF